MPIDNLTAKVGIGYGWDTGYSTGWDFRKSAVAGDISDEPYLRAGLEWKF